MKENVPISISTNVVKQSIRKLDPLYLAKNNVVMFIVEVGFAIASIGGLFPSIWSQFILKDSTFYFQLAAILLVTIWFATFSEAIAEYQAKASVDFLRTLEREILARKLEDGKDVMVKSSSLKPGEEVKVYAGEIIPRDGLVSKGTAFVDESMLTGESNPVVKEKNAHVMGGTRVATDELVIEITAETGKSFLDQMVGLIESSTRPKTKNETALSILLAGLSIIFVIVIGGLFFFSHLLGYSVDIAIMVALLVALMPTTIGGLLPAIGVAGMARLGSDNIIVKSGKGIEAAGDCDILVLDKTGTITEGGRSAVQFVPMQDWTEEDVGQAAYAASIHDNTHEGKSILALAEENGFIPPLVEKMLVAKQIEFSAETRFSGIEFVPKRRAIREKTTAKSESKFAKILLELDRKNQEIRLLKGSLDTMFRMVEDVNEAELKWKAQAVSLNGCTPLVIAINKKVIGLVVLKDAIKKGIKEKIDEIRATGIATVMITGDNKVTAQVIANEASIDQFVAEAVPADKLRRVEEEQIKGHVVGMVGDGANDAPALAKSDIGLAMNSGTAVAKEAANMIDLDSNPSKILNVVKIGKQLLMTRGAITTFSVTNDIAKYFTILPAIFVAQNPKFAAFNIMQLDAETAVLSTLIFNALVIPLLIPLALKGIKFSPGSPQGTFIRNMLIYGVGGALLPFIAIKGIDIVLSILV
ncbi:MAG: potassium-transporting ATPase subunit KdpB [Thaumarchaeota archaeon]|nr:potassium-transporting ATPase subunit KdpB [Nitrososphaerota archaeon]